MLAGASLVTHMFNAMSAFHHRDPGIVGLIADTEVLALVCRLPPTCLSRVVVRPILLTLFHRQS